MLRRPLILLLGLHLVLLGCDDSSKAPDAVPPASPAQQVSPTPAASPMPKAIPGCELLTHQDAEALARTPLDAGIEGPEHSPGCQYTGPASGPVAQVEVYIGDGAKKILDIDRDELKHTFAVVPGIGDEAHEEEGAIFFRKGTTWVAIRLVLLNDPAENRDPLRDAARKAVGRL